MAREPRLRIGRVAWATLILAFAPGCELGWGPSTPLFAAATVLGEGREWRGYPLVADVDADGHLDIVATHRHPLERNSLHIWRGTEDGSFEELEQTWQSPGYSGLAAGDIDGDGHTDLLAVSHFQRIHTLLGNGSGRFRESVLKTQDGYVAARLADVTGDGHLDAIVLGWMKAGLEVYAGDGTGRWTSVERLTEGIGRDLELGDVNGDGEIDLVAGLANEGVLMFLRDGAESWSRRATEFFSATREFRSLALADINRDGHLDVALNGGFMGLGEPNGPDVYLADGEGGWTQASKGLKVLRVATESVAVGDLDGDGHLDLVAGGIAGDELGDGAHGLFLFRGDGKGNWTLREGSGLPTEGLMRSYGLALVDLNGDERLDIVTTHGSTEKVGGSVAVWMHR